MLRFVTKTRQAGAYPARSEHQSEPWARDRRPLGFRQEGWLVTGVDSIDSMILPQVHLGCSSQEAVSPSNGLLRRVLP